MDATQIGRWIDRRVGRGRDGQVGDGHGDRRVPGSILYQAGRFERIVGEAVGADGALESPSAVWRGTLRFFSLEQAHEDHVREVGRRTTAVFARGFGWAIDKTAAGSIDPSAVCGQPCAVCRLQGATARQRRRGMRTRSLRHTRVVCLGHPLGEEKKTGGELNFPALAR